ncbi:RidA family protein [Rhizobium leguminosarum]|uniref:RidA family protein n=1 Tax=Rhizobium leguminosarum TaxID=384 RepID=UPI001C90D558|nr:RidA family protein [Rhizobium leguminosarum]MBY2918789.1 RidA family protein [Rhizobium leguminosarum]MBY2974437.1 RidA family protein [Rhizobium leguminosarum]MBY2981919.1 RidA family protein [Rhizobium leguminosarum]MBY3010386.1 RidA family protein [Rhizobium leguminosarum]
MVGLDAEARIRERELALPSPPTPFGAYVEAVQSGSLLFLSGMLPVVDHAPGYVGLVGRDLTVADGYEAARTACLNGLAAARSHLGSLDRIRAIAKLGVYIACPPDFHEHPKVADGASELLLDVFGPARLPPRVVLGVSSIPLGMPVEIELVFEIGPAFVSQTQKWSQS